ncbi:MAG: PxKF domain-containing protein [Mycobacteriaceae bacterium]
MRRTNCDGQPTDEVEQTVTAGSSGLNFDSGSGHYTYVWKTDKAWAGTCQRFTLALRDGSTHSADFKFH